VEDVRALHPEHAAEEPGLEDDVVARRRLARRARGRRSGVRGGEVVLREHERGEVDLARELEQAVERVHARLERRRPGVDVGDLAEAALQRLHQLRLRSRRSQEDARLGHPYPPAARTDSRPKTKDAAGVAPGRVLCDPSKLYAGLVAATYEVAASAA
jgi:hypothetical protein